MHPHYLLIVFSFHFCNIFECPAHDMYHHIEVGSFHLNLQSRLSPTDIPIVQPDLGDSSIETWVPAGSKLYQVDN